MAAWVAPAIAAAATLGSAGIQAATQRGSPSTAWQIPLQTQHDFDMFNLNQNYNWAMWDANKALYNQQVADNRLSSEIDFNRQQAHAYQMAVDQRLWEQTMAQNSIGWRVADAQRAGISPLVALGAPTFSPAPSAVGISGGTAPGVMGSGGGPLGSASTLGAAPEGPVDNSWISRMGANLGDIAMKALTPEDQREIAEKEIMSSQRIAYGDEMLRGARLDNAAKVKALGHGANPAAGSNSLDGQNSALGRMKLEDAKKTTIMPNQSTVESGAPNPAVQWVVGNNGLRPTPSKASGISDSDLSSAEYTRWAGAYLTGDPRHAPTPDQWAAHGFPGVQGSNWNWGTLSWTPVYRKGGMTNPGNWFSDWFGQGQRRIK